VGYADGASVPESVAPNIRGRSYTIAAELDVETPEGGGVLFEQGSRFGGHALYVTDGKLKYVYNMLGELVQTIESEETIPTAGFLLGRAGGEPVSEDYPGQSPWPYAGGTVKRVLIDVSGESFADLAREAAAAYARQ
jgi:hypothetical protein